MQRLAVSVLLSAFLSIGLLGCGESDDGSNNSNANNNSNSSVNANDNQNNNTEPGCGDGVVHYGEQCDDGNTESGDGCSSECQYEPQVWVDPISGLSWQDPPSEDWHSWLSGPAHCGDLVFGGFDDWRVPTIDELRSLVRGCPDVETGGSCGVTDSCVEWSCEDVGVCSCSADGGPGVDGAYWPPALRGEVTWYWSTSSFSYGGTDMAWYLDFSWGGVNEDLQQASKPIRCVRDPE